MVTGGGWRKIGQRSDANWLPKAQVIIGNLLWWVSKIPWNGKKMSNIASSPYLCWEKVFTSFPLFRWWSRQSTGFWLGLPCEFRAPNWKIHFVAAICEGFSIVGHSPVTQSIGKRCRVNGLRTAIASSVKWRLSQDSIGSATEDGTAAREELINEIGSEKIIRPQYLSSNESPINLFSLIRGSFHFASTSKVSSSFNADNSKDPLENAAASFRWLSSSASKNNAGLRVLLSDC